MEITTISGKKLGISEVAANGACVPLDTFEYLNQLGEGTYGVVYRARDKRDDSIVALKTVRIFESDKGEGIPITALREISILRSLRHPNVINVLEVAVGKELDEIFMVEEYAEQDLANVLDTIQVKFTPSEVKCLVKQLLDGLQYGSFDSCIVELTPSDNLSPQATADFGMAREKSGWMTPQPVTIWYRSPELLFGSQSYSYSVDLWSAGCIMAELITSQPLLPGSTEKEEMDLIVSLIGPPSETSWAGFKRLPWASKYNAPAPLKRREGLKTLFSSEKQGLVELLSDLLVYNPDSRPTAKEALAYKYFQESPAPQDPSLLPTFPEVRNEVEVKKSKTQQDKREILLFDEGELRSKYGSGKKRKADEV